DRDARLEKCEAFNPSLAAILELVSAARVYLLHRSRHPEVKRVPDEGAVKPFRRYTNDRVIHAIESLLAANNGRIAVIAFLPCVIADHDYRMRIAADVFGQHKRAAQYGANSKDIEVVRGNHAADRAFGPIADAECGAADVLGNERLHQLAVSLQILEVRPGG